MSENTLKFDNTKVNKKEFYKSKQPSESNWVNVSQIVISDRFEHNDYGLKYFIGYKDVNIVRLLCIILPQMSGYIKYFETMKKTYHSLLEIIVFWLNTIPIGVRLKRD